MYKFKNFSESGNKAITAAASIAGKMGHITVGSEHILMGILSCGKSDAADLLAENGLSFVCVYNVVVNLLGIGSPTVLTVNDMSRNALYVLKTAHGEALKRGRAQAGTNEILFAMMTSEKCMANQIMHTMVKKYDRFQNSGENLCSGVVNRAVTADNSRLKTLCKYARDLTEAARQKPFDPCIDREKETDMLIEILLRRQKNNPCLIGLAGVGKTAIVEGLANRIASGNVPQAMKSKKIYSLDIPDLLAGTKYRGDFEERVKAVVEEASGDRDLILFIDEVHLLSGAGGAEGAIDAANLLKPALARGKIQVIGATTQDEYTRIIEKDSALERRFSTIYVKEPSLLQAKNILHGLKEKYRSFHGVEITDEAIESCVELSSKYIIYRNLPDKAIDVMDQCCAAARLAGRNNVTVENVEQIISKTTGVAVTKLQEKEKNRFNWLEQELADSIAGQTLAVKTIVRSIGRWRAGLKSEKGPVASFFFAGPTGVGKTYSCIVLAQLLFGSEDALVRIDCTEYSEKNDVTKLIGSPPGYVGYDDGGRLEREMGNTPCCVVLFDEIEKAHPDLHNLLLQAMDSGFITTSKGKKINFRNSVIVMTSNAGAEIFSNKNRHLGFTDVAENSDMTAKLKMEMKKYFSSEFVGRIDSIVPFCPLDKQAVEKIVGKYFDELVSKLKKQDICLEYDKKAVEYICDKNPSAEYGARHIQRIIADEIETIVVDMILAGQLSQGSCAQLSAAETPFVCICEKV